MPVESVFSMPTLLWVAGSLIAFFLLIGSMNRRRMSLTELLRGYVDRHQSKFKNQARQPRADQQNQGNSDAPPPQSPTDP